MTPTTAKRDLTGKRGLYWGHQVKTKPLHCARIQSNSCPSKKDEVTEPRLHAEARRGCRQTSRRWRGPWSPAPPVLAGDQPRRHLALGPRSRAVGQSIGLHVKTLNLLHLFRQHPRTTTDPKGSALFPSRMRRPSIVWSTRQIRTRWSDSAPCCVCAPGLL